MTAVDHGPGVDHRSVWNDAFARSASLFTKCPYDYIASFLFRYRPADVAPAEVGVLELGFGSGINLWFAAQQGFRVAGVDVSDRAIAAARTLFVAERISADLRRAPFTALPFADSSFDLAFDRSALSYASRAEARDAVREVGRVLKPGGRFLFNPYSSRSSAASVPAPFEAQFYNRRDVRDMLAGWKLLELVHVEEVDEEDADRERRAQWRAVAERL